MPRNTSRLERDTYMFRSNILLISLSRRLTLILINTQYHRQRLSIRIGAKTFFLFVSRENTASIHFSNGGISIPKASISNDLEIQSHVLEQHNATEASVSVRAMAPRRAGT